MSTTTLKKPAKKRRRALTAKNLKAPVVWRGNTHPGKDFEGFPVDHYSYSAWVKFCTDPFMFKVTYLNGDTIDTAQGAPGVLGKGLHKAMESYFGGGDNPAPPEESEAIKHAFIVGQRYLDEYPDGFIKWNATIPTRAKMMERYSFAYFGYLKEMAFDVKENEVIMVEKMLKHRIGVEGKNLPIPLKSYQDLVYRKKSDGRIWIRDHKFASKRSSEEVIDGNKLVQAAFGFFTVYAETGEAPAGMIFGEYKIVENTEKGLSQLQDFVIEFDKNPLVFELFYRMYADITAALLGHQVFVPNLNAMFDKEVSLLAYIHRLDVDEKKAEVFKKMKVDNITDFLKKKIQNEGHMKKLEEALSKKFISGVTLNYKDMSIEERIKMKLAEHGLGLEFDSKVIGGSVTLYRYSPSVGIKMSRIEKFSKDVEQVIGATGVRILAPIPDSELVGFEVPNKVRTFPGKSPKASGFELPIGVDVMGKMHSMDIREAPHILVAGSTGSGKSVFVTELATHLLNTPGCELAIMDPKRVELSEFDGIVRTYCDDIMDIRTALDGIVIEMEERYKKLKLKGVKNLEAYRRKGGKTPYLFVFIDEYGDLVAQNYVHTEEVEDGEYLSGPRQGDTRFKTVKTDISKEIQKNILLLAQKARAAGIHIILTTQHPITKIVDSAIKANFPTRVAFRTASASGSSVIIDQEGAEKLLGKGDMLLLRSDGSPITRLQAFL